MLSIEISNESDFDWNKRLLSSDFGTIHNTKEYASYATTLGRKPYFVKFLNRGKIVGQVILFESDRFEKKGMIMTHVLRSVPRLKKSVYRWSYGPVILDSTLTDEICNTFSEFLISKNAVMSGSEHPLLGGSLSCFRKPFEMRPWATFMIDLTQDLDEVWKKLDKHSARKNIERSQKRGVHIKEINDSNLFQYSEMLAATKRKVGIELHESDVRILWDNLRKIGFTGFIAYVNEIPIGGIIVSFFNKYVNEWGIARTEKDTNEKLYAQDLLKWQVIEWGIHNKFKYYDLTGVNPNFKDDKEEQIFRYKKKFGGNLIKYNLIAL